MGEGRRRIEVREKWEEKLRFHEESGLHDETLFEDNDVDKGILSYYTKNLIVDIWCKNGKYIEYSSILGKKTNNFLEHLIFQ